eukprot:gene1744-2404_t
MTAAPLTTTFTGRPQHDPASVAYAERAVQMVLQRRQEAEYAAYVSSAYSASVMQGGSIGGYYGGHPAVPVLQPMGQGSPWQPMHIEHPGVSSSTILEPLRQHMERLTSNFSLPTSGDLDDPVPPTREVFYPDCHDVVPADPDRRRSRRSSGPDSWARQELPFRPESVSPPTSPPSSASGSRETSVRALRRRNAKARERRLAEKAALETRTAVVEQDIAAQLTPAFAELGKGLQDTLREAMATNTDTLRGCLQQFRTQTAQATTTPQHGELMTADPVVEGTQLSAAQAAQLVKARRKSLETVVVMGGDAHAVSDGTPHARSDTAASGAEGTYLGFGAGSSSRGATRKSAGIGDHAGAGGDPGGLGGELSLPEDDPSPGPPDGKPPGGPPPGPPGGSGGSHRGRALLFTAEGASLWVPEEEVSMLDSDCLAAWTELSSSEWFQRLCHPSESTLAIVPAAPFPMAPAATSGHATPGREAGKVPSAGYADPEEPSDRAVYEESKVEQNVDKLVDKLRKFPSKSGLSEEDKVMEMEGFSRSRQQVAAMFWAMSRDEGLDWVPDNLQDEVQSLAEVDPDGVMELAALTGCTDLMADIEAKVAVLRSDDPARQ